MPPTFGVMTVTSLLRIGPVFISISGNSMAFNKRRKDPPPQQQTPQPQSMTGASAGTGRSTGTGTATQATSVENRQFDCVHCSASFGLQNRIDVPR